MVPRSRRPNLCSQATSQRDFLAKFWATINSSFSTRRDYCCSPTVGECIRLRLLRWRHKTDGDGNEHEQLNIFYCYRVA